MPKYKLKLFEYQKIKNTWELDFDTTDQVAWDALLQAAASFDSTSPDENCLFDIPKLAPTDPKKWFELAKLIHEAQSPFICTNTAEVVTLQNGESEISTGYQLETINGDIVQQEVYDEMW